jgi:hypothetical protein
MLPAIFLSAMEVTNKAIHYALHGSDDESDEH